MLSTLSTGHRNYPAIYLKLLEILIGIKMRVYLSLNSLKDNKFPRIFGPIYRVELRRSALFKYN
jgi:hypothetical protein